MEKQVKEKLINGLQKILDDYKETLNAYEEYVQDIEKLYEQDRAVPEYLEDLEEMRSELEYQYQEQMLENNIIPNNKILFTQTPTDIKKQIYKERIELLEQLLEYYKAVEEN